MLGSLFAILSIHYSHTIRIVNKKMYFINGLLTILWYLDDGRIIVNSGLTQVSASDT